MPHISFITWSRSLDQYLKFQDSAYHVKNCEFIAIPNPPEKGGQTSMAKAYNVGTKMAKGEILVYVHEDVRLIDSRFDELVTKATEDPKTGFVGPIGTTGVSTGAWWETPRNYYKGFIVGDGKMDDNGYYDGPAKGLDALFMATRHKFVFPEELPGVHFVDQWSCRLAEERGLTNRIFPVVVQHLSQGEATSESYQNNLKLYQQRWFPHVCQN